MSEELGLYGMESQTPETGELFEKDSNLSYPPLNMDEVTAQLALADDKDSGRPFNERVKDRQRAVEAQGTEPLMQDVVKQERADHIAGLRNSAEQSAQQRDIVGLESAARLIRDAQAKQAQTPTKVEGMKATAQRSLEAVGFQYAAPRYKNLQRFDEAVSAAADSMTLRNLVAAAQSELEGQTSLWDKISHFAGLVVLSPVYEIIGQSAINRATGGSGVNPLTSFTSVQELRTFFLGLRPEERVELVNGLMKEELGMFGENKSANIELLRKLGEMTLADSGVDAIFNALTVVDGAQIGRLLFKAVRRGAPVNALNSVAGQQSAAGVVVRDLTAGTKTSGLNETELAAKLLAFGKNPMDIDPASFAGLSAQAQEQLRKGWNEMLDATRNRLISSGLTPEEMKQGLADIQAKYMTTTNPTIHNVVFGEGDETGQLVTVFWQGPDGKAFVSKEAAEEWAKAEGKANYVVVPRNAAENTTLAAKPKSGVNLSPTVPPTLKSGNVLSSLKGHPDEIDDVFDNVVTATGGDPMSEQISNLWKKAAQHENANAVTAEALLRIIAQQSSSPEMRFLADHLLSTGKRGIKWKKIRAELHWDLPGNNAADYALTSDTVRLTLQHAVDEETIVHEMLHAHNSQLITLVKGNRTKAEWLLERGQIKAVDELLDLHKRLNNWRVDAVMAERAKHGSLVDVLGEVTPNAPLKNALAFPAELLTYGLTHPAVRKQLSRIKLADLGYANSKQSVMSFVWDIFRRMLGLKANDTALAKLVSVYEKMTNVVDEAGRTVLSRSADTSEVATLMWNNRLAVKKNKVLSIDEAIDKEIAKEEKKLLKVGDDEREAIIARINALRASKKEKPAAPPAPATAAEEWLVKEQRIDPISVNNVGKFSDEDIRSMPWLAIDPKHAASELAVEERVIGVHAEAKTKRDLTKFLTPYFDKLSNAGKARVKEVLTEGDGYSNAGGQVGKEFSYSELRGKGLSEDEALAYFATRQVRMVSYHLRNGEMVRALRAEGMREIEFLGTGEKMAGQVLEQGEATSTLGKVVYDTTTGKPYLVDSKTIEDSYKAGKRIVKLKHPAQFGVKHYSHVLVDESTARARDIVTALHYRPGEFSRIYTDQYFITVRKMVDVDGEVKEVSETVRTAASTREAQDYVTAHRKAFHLILNGKATDQELERLVGRYTNVEELKASFNKGELDGYVSMDFHYTRNREEFLNGSISEAMTNGRLFTSKRSDRLFSTDRTRVNTLDVYESLSHEITNISRVTNISMWRENMIRRWMNTFGHMIPNRTGNDISDFFTASGASFTRGTADAQFAERTHSYIVRQIGVKTGEEKFYEGLTRTITEKFFTGNEGIESIGAKIRTMSWLGFIRNVNFNLNLGMFNPAQLLVQANGAVTAAILSPIHGAKAAMTFPLLRMALMSDNPSVWRTLARVEKFKNLGLSNEAEFVELVKGIRKAGILDNVRSTSLWNLEEGALNVYAGYPSKGAKSHTFFFNRGEEFSRVVSFDVARREWMSRHPGQAWNTNEALKHIVVRMDDLTQNMTKANLARFQEGVLSIPLQFAQYNIKLGANILSAYMTKGTGRGFTKFEASWLLLGHTLLYGGMGNGLMMVADEFLGTELKDKLSVSQKQLLAQGTISWAFDQAAQLITGEEAKVALGSRLGSFDYYQRIGEAVYKDPKNVYEALLGPTVASAKRLGVFGEVAHLWWKDPELTGQDVLEGLSKIGVEQVASLRNAAKAYLYHQHQGLMLDRHGVAMAKLNKNELLMQALGFQPTAAVDLNRLIQSKQDHNEALDDIAKMVLKTQRDILTALKNENYERAEDYKKTLQALWPQNAGDFMEVQKRVRDRLYPHETEMQKLLGEYIWKGQTYNRPVIVTEQPRAK